ncbi:hypothetical protein [Azospirillum argentinense]|uniref:Uncharacterized protein n=1 Tax=Azospirillum argentinense TaxID=2970906 RepID=A0A5B0KRX7_9PROT|nr:hypothetical protein [Azospirillum argentinense]KAA1054685.1 hypothetical protein FH063_005961 [Azospirillum argentinense]
MSERVTETKTAFSQRVGLSKARVSQLVAKGLPCTESGQVDVRAALDWMSRTLDPTQRMAQAVVKVRPKRRDAADCTPEEKVSAFNFTSQFAESEINCTEQDSAEVAPINAETHNTDDLRAARIAHEWVKVERARLALERERGDVAPWSEIDRVLFEHGRRSRDAWLAWAQRVVPDMAGELRVDGALLTAVLRRYVTTHLTDLSAESHRGH